MIEELKKLEQFWEEQDLLSCRLAKDSEFLNLENRHSLSIPLDLQKYFRELNGTGSKLDSNLFEFYALDEFVPILQKYKEWEEIPSCQDIQIATLRHQDCFVFANYMMNTFEYAIRLNRIETTMNEIYIFCGGKYKVIASSFTEFIGLYLEDAESLYF